MTIARNEAGTFVPIRERRSATGTIGALNAEVVLDVNGDQNAVVHVVSSSLIGTLEFTGTSDSTGAGYHAVAAYPYSVGCAGGTIPIAGQPLLTDALVAAMTTRVYAIPCGQLRKLRVRASAYTSGTAAVTITADPNDSLHTGIVARPTSTFTVSQTAATGVAVTASCAAVTGLRHVIDSITITRSATALLTASATPVVVTTTNIPGSLAFTFGADAATQGTDKVVSIDFGATGMATTTLGTATTVVCPATTGVIWRVNVVYRLGL